MKTLQTKILESGLAPRSTQKYARRNAAWISAVLAVASIAPAMASELQAQKLSAPLPSLNLDTKLPYAEDVNSGLVSLDLTEGKVRVQLSKKSNCPEGVVCTVSPDAPVVLELPIVEIQQTNCKTVIYRALEDQSANGGLKQEIEVQDNRHNRCPHLDVLPATEVIYTTDGLNHEGQMQQTESRMDGGVLKPTSRIAPVLF